MSDPFTDDFLLVWTSEDDEPIFLYASSKDVADSSFDAWVAESIDNGEEQAAIVSINLSEVRRKKGMHYDRHWMSNDG